MALLSCQHYQAALLLSALGDALGWPQEFQRGKGLTGVRNFKTWRKRSGGKYWGYLDPIQAGEYSDDTQLMLALVRSIQPHGEFWPEHFAYLELPFWLHYERGGGRATKQAAKNLLKHKTLWYDNRFGKQGRDYLMAGGNGAAMRTLPISLAFAHQLNDLLRHTLSHSLITHGHPRGFIGALVLACAHYQLIQNGKLGHRALGHLIKQELPAFFQSRHNWPEELKLWWGHHPDDYLEACLETINEVIDMLRLIPEFLTQHPAAYFERVGCLNRETKGSGTATVAAAIFLYFQNQAQPIEAIYTAANLLGSDTDTIASMVGGLVGLETGEITDPNIVLMLETLQDTKYLNILGQYLYHLHDQQNEPGFFEQLKPVKPNKVETLNMVLSWEMGLHEMFWDLLENGDRVSHPALGMGYLVKKDIFSIEQRPDYEARIFKVRFDTGQSVYFHSRVAKESWEINQSLETLVRQELALAG